MKSLKYIGCALVGLAGLTAPAQADHHHDHWSGNRGWWGGHGWGWNSYRYPVVVAPAIGINVYPARRNYYGGYYGGYHRSLEVDVQVALSRRGYYRGPIDGDIGPGSRAAIRAYQYDRGLPVTGGIDRYLMRSLGL